MNTASLLVRAPFFSPRPSFYHPRLSPSRSDCKTHHSKSIDNAFIPCTSGFELFTFCQLDAERGLFSQADRFAGEANV